MEAGQVALPEGFVVDQGDDRLAMQDNLARAADRATAEKRNPAKDSEVLALQAKLEKLPLFGKSSGLPEGFEVDAPANPIKQQVDLRAQARDMLTAGPKQLNELLTGENALPVLLGKFAGYVSRKAELTNAMRAPDEDGVSPVEREIARRKGTGEPVDFRSIEAWMDQTVEKRMFPNREQKNVDPVEYGKQVVQGMIDHPLDAAKGFVSYAVTHPEVLAAGPVVGFLIMVGESMVEQKVDTGKIDAPKLLVDSGLNATGMFAIHAAVRGANYRAAKTTGAEPTAKVEEQALTAINEKVKEGISEGQAPQAAAAAALDDVLAVMKIAPEERAAIVKGTEDAISEGQQQKGGGPEHPGVEVERPQAESSSGDRPVERAQAEVEPRPVRDLPTRVNAETTNAASQAVERPPTKVADELQRLQDYERRVATDVEGLKGEEKYQALREASKEIADLKAGPAPIKLSEIKPEIGWSETGGSIIRDPATGDVVGRTTWIPKSEFWQERPGPTKISERAAHEAIKKADAGERLTPKEQRFVDYAKEELGKRNREAFDAERAAYAQGKQRALDAVEAQRRAAEDARLSAHEAAEERLGIQEFGKADPKLLAMLALPGVGAAAGYWLGGNTGEKVRDALIGGGIGAASLVLGKVRGAALRVTNAIGDKRYRLTDESNQFNREIALGRLVGYQAKHTIRAMVRNTKARSEMLFALEAGEASKLPKVMQEALAHGSTMMRGVRDGAVAKGVDMGPIIENYATHAYVRGLNTKEGLFDNLMGVLKDQGGTGGMSPKSRWAKQRVIPSYKEAMARGLVPVTTDFADIVEMYINSVTRTVAVKNYLDTLGAGKLPTGEPFGVSGKNLEAEIKRRTNEALGRPDPAQLDLIPAARRLDAEIAAIKSPSDYTFINHPQLRDKLWHRDLAPAIRGLVGADEPWLIERMAHAGAIAAKMLTFSGSMFHTKSLADAGMGAGFGAFRTGALKKIRDPNNALVKEAVASGLNIIDRPMEAEVAPVRNALRYIEEKIPFGVGITAKGVRMTQDGMNHFLWGNVHPKLKFNVWESIFQRALDSPTILNRLGRKVGMAPNWDGVARPEIARMVTEFTNDLFGGINWFEIANNVHTKYGRDLALALASPRGRRFMQIVALAPDWTVATARSMYKALPGMSEPQVAALHRQYLMRQAIVYLTLYDGINRAMSGHHIWENDDPTMVDMGDGRRIQIAKHTMEPIHWMMQPRQQAWNKLGSPIKEPVLQLMNKDWLTLKGKTIGGPDMDTSILGRIKHAGESFLPIPAKTLFGQGLLPAVSGFAGAPIYGKTQEQRVDDAIERALNLREKRLESDDPAERAKGRRRSDTETAAAARDRVNRQYQKQRDEQRKREAR